jgi:hypothetical protein
MLRVLLPLLIVLCLSPAGPAFAKDDPDKLAQAKELVATITAQRKSKDAAGLLESFKTLVDLHNGLQDKSTRGKMQKAVGSVLKDRKLGDAHGTAVSTLSELNDSKGAYKQLKKYVPGPKEEKMSDLGGQVLGAVARLAPDGALGALYDLAEKAKDWDAGAAAIIALGHYGKSKKRVDVLETLIKLVGRFKPSQGAETNIGEATLKRWEKLSGPLILSLNRLTGQKVRDPDEWLQMWKENKKRPSNLFVDE